MLPELSRLNVPTEVQQRGQISVTCHRFSNLRVTTPAGGRGMVIRGHSSDEGAWKKDTRREFLLSYNMLEAINTFPGFKSGSITVCHIG